MPEATAATTPVGESLAIVFPGSASILTDHVLHGEGLIAHGLLLRLSLRGHRVLAFTDRTVLDERPPYEVIAVDPGPLESLRPVWRAANIHRVLRRRGDAFDVCHWLFPQDPHEIAFARISGLPLVIGPLTTPWPTPTTSTRKRPGDVVRGALDPWLRRKYQRAIATAGTLAAVPSVLDDLDEATASTTTVLPFPIDVRSWPVTPAPHRPSALFLGRLSPEKNPLALLEACRLLPREMDWRLVVAGGGPLEHRVREIAKNPELRDRVEVLGEVRWDSVPGLIAESSLVCLPSNGEPFGRAVVEAMAAGRAVLAGTGGGPDYLVQGERGGAQVDGSNALQIRDALAHLLSSPQRLKDIGAANRRRALAEFDYEPALDALENVYRAAIASGATGNARG